MNSVHKIIFAILILTMPAVHFAQENEILRVTDLKLLFCVDRFTDDIERNQIIIQYIDDQQISCVDRVRITFQNLDYIKISRLKFDLIISFREENSFQTYYKARHNIDIVLLPDEVISYDLKLFNRISLPFTDQLPIRRDDWKWDVIVIKVN